MKEPIKVKFENGRYRAYFGKDDVKGIKVGKTYAVALAKLGWEHSGEDIEVTH